MAVDLTEHRAAVMHSVRENAAHVEDMGHRVTSTSATSHYAVEKLGSALDSIVASFAAMGYDRDTVVEWVDRSHAQAWERWSEMTCPDCHGEIEQEEPYDGVPCATCDRHGRIKLERPPRAA